MTTKREKVRNALMRAQENGEGPVCANSLAHPACGGRRAAARIAELRDEGMEIRTVTCPCVRCRWAHDQAISRGERHTRGVAYQIVPTAGQQTLDVAS